MGEHKNDNGYIVIDDKGPEPEMKYAFDNRRKLLKTVGVVMLMMFSFAAGSSFTAARLGGNYPYMRIPFSKYEIPVMNAGLHSSEKMDVKELNEIIAEFETAIRENVEDKIVNEINKLNAKRNGGK